MKKVKMKIGKHIITVNEDEVPVIESLSSYDNMHKYFGDLAKERDKTVRKQVCDDIRQKAIHTKTGYMGFTEKGYYTIYAGELERIEKGE